MFRLPMVRRIVPQWLSRVDVVPDPMSHADIWRIAQGPDSEHSMRERAHAALREILARYAGISTERLRIENASGGKPFLATPPGAVEFNLSHCPDLALLAVSMRSPVGVDVEADRKVDDPLRLARRVLDVSDLALLEAQTPAGRPALFLDLWTQFESRQKALGRGIFAERADPDGLRGISFRPTGRHIACVSLVVDADVQAVRFIYYDAVIASG